MADPVMVRPFEDADLPGVLDLLRLSLGESAVLERSPELFAWKHLDNPFGRSLLLVAEDSAHPDRPIVGLRAFMRWELVTPGGDRIRCVRAVDTATHPEYQRRGIFRRLTLSAVDEAEADGVDMVFNTPNPKSGAGYLSMGWQEVGSIGVLAMPGRGLLRRRPDPAVVPDPADQVTAPTAATGQFDDVAFDSGPFVEVRAPLGLRTPRSGAYLRWRFSGHPTARYVRIDAAGSAAVLRPNIRNRLRELVVSDVFGPRPEAAIGAAWRAGRSHYLAGWFSAGSPERRAAARRGMFPVPGLKTLTLVARPLRPLPVPVGDLAAWDLASSDLELL